MPIYWGLEDVQELQSELMKGKLAPSLPLFILIYIYILMLGRLMNMANALRAEWTHAETIIKVSTLSSEGCKIFF